MIWKMFLAITELYKIIFIFKCTCTTAHMSCTLEWLVYNIILLGVTSLIPIFLAFSFLHKSFTNWIAVVQVHLKMKMILYSSVIAKNIFQIMIYFFYHGLLWFLFWKIWPNVKLCNFYVFIYYTSVSHICMLWR
jgi:hypothetical protein